MISKYKQSCVKTCVAMLGMLLVGTAWANPSGGPDGPQRQTYELPADASRAHYAAPNGDSQSEGATVESPTTIESAIRRAQTGDVIVLRGGTYRTGGLLFNQGITIQPYEDESPILNGCRVATDWERVNGGLWRTKWETLFPASPENWWNRKENIARTPLYLFNNDMVFSGDRLLRPVAWAGEVDQDSYWIDYDKGFVYIGTDPSSTTIEITAHDGALKRTTARTHGKDSDGKPVHLRGIVLTRYAARAIEIAGTNPNGIAQESEFGHAVPDSVIEHCTISFCSRVAGYFRGNGLQIRHCLISDTCTEGIFLLSSSDVLFERNIITRVNSENITGVYPAAIKIYNQCHRVTVRDNLITENPNCNGVWYDVGTRDGVFVNNIVRNTDNALFFEISHGIRCVGNVFVDCPTGVKILNSRDARIYHNTFVDSGVTISRDGRNAANDGFGWHASTGPEIADRAGHEVVSNLLVASRSFGRPLVVVDQAESLQGRISTSQTSVVDRNVYVFRSGAPSSPAIRFRPPLRDEGGPLFDSAADFNAAFPDFATHSQTLTNQQDPLFRAPHANDFGLVEELVRTRNNIPPEILSAAGWDSTSAPSVGATPAPRD